MSVLFGTRDNMQWVPAPLANYASPKIRWRAVDQYINGGAAVRESATAHREFNLSWPVSSAETVSPILRTLDMPGPYYYQDPLAMEKNLVPSYWATTMLVTEDAPPLVPGVTPTLVTGTANDNGFPVPAARFVVPSARASNLSVYVPAGYKVGLGVYGSGGTHGFNATGTLAKVSPTGATRYVAGGTTAGWRTLWFSAATHVVQAISLIVIPSDQEFPTGTPFVPGLGHSGLSLRDNPSVTEYSAVLENAQIGVSADFVEVGAWL